MTREVVIITVLHLVLGITLLVYARRPWAPFNVRRFTRNWGILNLLMAACIVIVSEVWK